MNRYKSVGWRNESYRHSLARKGIKTKYRKMHSDIVKNFPGQNPRMTANFVRFRQKNPSLFVAGSFRTKTIGKDTKIIVGKLKSSGKYVVQSIMIKK